MVARKPYLMQIVKLILKIILSDKYCPSTLYLYNIVVTFWGIIYNFSKLL